MQSPNANHATPPHDVGDACGNWVWLCDIERREAALDVALRPSAMALALRRHFAVVHQISPSPDVVEFTRLRAAQTDEGDDVETAVVDSLDVLPYEDESFDCVTLHGTLDARTGGVLTPGSRRRGDASLLRECRRLLRAGGWLYLGAANPLWSGLIRRPVRLAAAARVLHRASPAFVAGAGFDPVQAYYAFPGHDHPRVLVPATRAATTAYLEITGRRTGAEAHLRHALRWTPAHRAFAPSLVYLARARDHE